MNALVATREPLVWIELHGVTFISIDHLSCIAERLPDLIGLLVVNNTAVNPESFLDTLLPLSKLRIYQGAGQRSWHCSCWM
jgi:hypothetical protein